VSVNDSKIKSIIDDYQWFIDHTQVESQCMLAWIADKNKRDEAFEKSNKFGKNIYNVLKKIDKNNLISLSTGVIHTILASSCLDIVP
jgi:protease II